MTRSNIFTSSVGGVGVGRSVGQSVGRSVGRSVRSDWFGAGLKSGLIYLHIHY